ncbi:MAG TPA: DMT family transporter [Anaeromyxobacteraceae bacterium]|nr:DMT family transporter [Anaeromyxobacteraceae bacterium]
MPWLLLALALVAGAGLPVQAGVNASLRTSLGRPELAALVNFLTGLLALATWILAQRLPWPEPGALARAPWWSWTGGLLGAFYVTAVIVLAPRLGVATTIAVVVGGQMLSAVAIDHYGLFGVPLRPVSAARGLGAVLLVAGVVLLRRF